MNSRIADAQNFLDIGGLDSIRQQSNADDNASKEAALESAAKQFEAIFMQMLMKSMRKAQDVLESDSPFNSQSTKFYRDMHDQQMSLELSNNGSLGLSELIVRQLGGKSDEFTPHTILRNDGNIDSRNQRSAQSVKKTEPEQLIVASTSSASAFEKDLVQKTDTQVPTFTTPQDFISALTAPAKNVEKSIGVPFEVVIAQSALETGWGQKIIKNEQGESSNNLFNIKADSRWQGDKTHKETLEFEQGAMVKKKEPFRVYESLNESAQDYINFLSSGDRYQSALDKVGNVEQFLQGLQSAGYATDPNYADKIMGALKTVTSLLNR